MAEADGLSSLTDKNIAEGIDKLGRLANNEPPLRPVAITIPPPYDHHGFHFESPQADKVITKARKDFGITPETMNDSTTLARLANEISFDTLKSLVQAEQEDIANQKQEYKKSHHGFDQVKTAVTYAHDFFDDHRDETTVDISLGSQKEDNTWEASVGIVPGRLHYSFTRNTIEEQFREAHTFEIADERLDKIDAILSTIQEGKSITEQQKALVHNYTKQWTQRIMKQDGQDNSSFDSLILVNLQAKTDRLHTHVTPSSPTQHSAG